MSRWQSSLAERHLQGMRRLRREPPSGFKFQPQRPPRFGFQLVANSRPTKALQTDARFGKQLMAAADGKVPGALLSEDRLD
jgi:hypothetical protein